MVRYSFDHVPDISGFHGTDSTEKKAYRASQKTDRTVWYSFDPVPDISGFHGTDSTEKKAYRASQKTDRTVWYSFDPVPDISGFRSLSYSRHGAIDTGTSFCISVSF
jgi:hypothetical protein